MMGYPSANYSNLRLIGRASRKVYSQGFLPAARGGVIPTQFSPVAGDGFRPPRIVVGKPGPANSRQSALECAPSAD